MAWQGLFFRTFQLISNSNNRGLLNNRISNINLQFPFMGVKQDTRAKLTQLKIPEKPKKPLSPYVKFVAEHRKDILRNNPNIKQTELIKKCAEEWKNVSQDVKSKYTDAYNLEKEKYEILFFKYQESLTREQKEAIEEFQGEKKEDRKKRKLRKIYKETNKPKRPMGAYVHYLVEESKIRNKTVKELMGLLKDEWHTLPTEEKQKYENMFLNEKQKYEVALHEWETRMMAEGRDELIKPKTKSKIMKIPENKPSRGHECLRSESSVSTGEGTLFHNETKECSIDKVHPVLQDNKNDLETKHLKYVSSKSNQDNNSFVSKNRIIVTESNMQNSDAKISPSSEHSSGACEGNSVSNESLGGLKKAASVESNNLPDSSPQGPDSVEKNVKDSLSDKLRKFFKF